MENQIVSNVQHLLNNYHEGHPPDKGEKIKVFHKWGSDMVNKEPA